MVDGFYYPFGPCKCGCHSDTNYYCTGFETKEKAEEFMKKNYPDVKFKIHYVGPLPKEKEVPTYCKCSCGRTIKANDNYYIRISPGEQPEVLCEFCVIESR